MSLSHGTEETKRNTALEDVTIDELRQNRQGGHIYQNLYFEKGMQGSEAEGGKGEGEERWWKYN